MKLKKNLLPAVLLLLTFQFAVAQNPVPNPSFENWTDGEPDNWSTSNQGDSIIFVTQVPTPHTGNFAMRGNALTAGGVDYYPSVGSVFPVSQQYSHFEFYYMLGPALGISSDFTVSIDMTDSNSNIVGTGGITFSANPTPSYTLASIPITYTGTPATCEITFALGFNDTIGGVYFVVDDMELTNTTGIAEKEVHLIQKIYPNPANHAAVIQLHSSVKSKTMLILSDIMGREIGRSEISEQKSEIDLGNFASGIYFIRIVSGHNTATEKLIVQH